MPTFLERKFVMKHTFINVKNRENFKYYYGNVETHFNIPWMLVIYTPDRFSKMRIHFECFKLRESYEWSIDTTVTTKVFTKDGEKVIEESGFFQHDGFQPQYLGTLYPIEDYLVDGNLTFECHVTIHKMTSIPRRFVNNFDDESVKEFSDIVLKVDDQNFYVFKMYLAYHSTYFKSLFLEIFEESKQSEVELKDIDPEDFQNFLQVLYGDSDINDYTVDGILRLADMYDVKSAIRQCEKFLIDYSELNLEYKFLLATQYKLEDLKRKCMPEFKTSEDIAAIISKDSDQFDTKLISKSFGNESAKEFSDVILKVKDQKFHVFKMYLAYHSSYFKSLFLGNFDESKQSEVELKDIEPEDFQNFLQILYGDSGINDDTVDGILCLADMYDAKSAIRQCEKFLIDHSKLDLMDKFLMSTQYKLEDLRRNCKLEFKTSGDIAPVIPENASLLKVWDELLNF